MTAVSLSPVERARKNLEDLASPLALGCTDLQRPFLGVVADASSLDIRRTWNSWQSMIDRCMIPGHLHADRYGDRGITVCERWFLFTHFVEDMGLRPDGMTLDRRDRDGHYEISNCRWATKADQARNTSRTVLIDGLTQREAARAAGVHESTLSRRRTRAIPATTTTGAPT